MSHSLGVIGTCLARYPPRMKRVLTSGTPADGRSRPGPWPPGDARRQAPPGGRCCQRPARATPSWCVWLPDAPGQPTRVGPGVAALCARIMEDIDEAITSLPIDARAAAAAVADLLGEPPDLRGATLDLARIGSQGGCGCLRRVPRRRGCASPYASGRTCSPPGRPTSDGIPAPRPSTRPRRWARIPSRSANSSACRIPPTGTGYGASGPGAPFPRSRCGPRCLCGSRPWGTSSAR